jgi:hypothetical protein
MATLAVPHLGWRSLEKIAFGLIYGAIAVQSLLLAIDDRAVVLFGSVLAISLARIIADLLSHAIETGERVLTWQALHTAWRHAHPTQSVANLPTALFLAAGLGWIWIDAAVTLSQLYCIAFLVVLGARVGWVVGRGPWLIFAGAVFSGGIGCALAIMKSAIH